MRKRLKLQFEDNSGSSYSISLQGNLSKEKVLRVIELVELMEGAAPHEQGVAEDGTVFTKIHKLAVQDFPLEGFTSADLLQQYEASYNEPVRLSTISTYLARLSERGILQRRRMNKRWLYRTARAMS